MSNVQQLSTLTRFPTFVFHIYTAVKNSKKKILVLLVIFALFSWSIALIAFPLNSQVFFSN